jgi:hypothetical protein
MRTQVGDRLHTIAASASGWPLERVLFAMAGTVTLASLVLALLVIPRWLVLTAFVGANHLAFVLVGGCAASLVSRRVFSLEPGSAR